MKPPREAAEDILFKTLVRGAPVAESIPWPHVTVLGEALTAAIEARDAEHAHGDGYAFAVLAALRTAGWSVAVHNDYRIGGVPMTFWGFSRGDRFLKGEAKTDGDALFIVADQADIELPAAPAVVPAETPPVTMDTGNDQPWSVREVLARLADAADHLLGDHSCDTHGHEGIRYALDAARGYLNTPRAPAPAVTPVPDGAPRELLHFLAEESPDGRLIRACVKRRTGDIVFTVTRDGDAVTCPDCIAEMSGPATPPTPSAPPAPLRCGNDCGASDCTRRCSGVDDHDRVICRCEDHGGGSPPRARASAPPREGMGPDKEGG